MNIRVHQLLIIIINTSGCPEVCAHQSSCGRTPDHFNLQCKNMKKIALLYAVAALAEAQISSDLSEETFSVLSSYDIENISQL